MQCKMIQQNTMKFFNDYMYILQLCSRVSWGMCFSAVSAIMPIQSPLLCRFLSRRNHGPVHNHLFIQLLKPVFEFLNKAINIKRHCPGSSRSDSSIKATGHAIFQKFPSPGINNLVALTYQNILEVSKLVHIWLQRHATKVFRSNYIKYSFSMESI